MYSLQPLALSLPWENHTICETVTKTRGQQMIYHLIDIICGIPTLLFNFRTLFKFRFSDWLICTTDTGL